MQTRSLTRLALLALACLGSSLSRAATEAEIAQGFREHAIVAKPKAGMSAVAITATEKSEGIAASSVLSSHTGARLLELGIGDTPHSAIARLRATGLYEYVEPDYLRTRHALPNDPKFTDNSEWHLRNAGNLSGTAGADIDAPLAWDTRTDASDVLVAVMDTGVRTTHEDLKANLWVNSSEIAGNNIDDDNNGYVDDVYGANVIEGKTGTETGNVADDQGHGTAVASVIGAAGNNGKGMVGVAWKAKILSLKWDDKDGSAFSSNGVRAIDYAIAKGVKIINVSYGGPYFSQAEYDALKKARDAGIIIVASAGNDHDNMDVVPTFPASYRLDNIIVAAATDRTDELANFSNYGSTVTDIAAPGVEIVAADRTSDTGYKTVDGTSFSAPIVTASLALLKAQFPSDDYRATINRLTNSVDVLTSLAGKVAAGGRVNLAKALVSTDDSPRNNRFARASTLEGSLLTLRASTKHATAEAGAPAIAGVSGSPLLWWVWKAPTTGTAIIDLDGSDFDTIVAVYTGTALNALTEVKSNDDASASVQTSRLEFSATKDTTYRIAIGGKASASGLAIATVGYVPSNNNFANATNLPGFSVSGLYTNRLANTEAGEPALVPSSDAAVDGATVWFKWSPNRASDRVFFNTIGHGVETVVRAYQGSSVSALTPIANTQDVDTPFFFTPTAGQTYYFAVDTLNGRTGSFTFVLTEAAIVFDMMSEVNGAPALDAERTNFVYATDGGLLEKLTLSPSSRDWAEVHGSLTLQSPAINGKGEIYFADGAGYLSKFDKNLTLLWEKEQVDTSYMASPAIAADGTVYVHSIENVVHAYRPDGTIRWTATLEKNEDGDAYGAVSIGSNGRLYVPSANKLFCLDPLDGHAVWVATTDDSLYASVTLDSNDNAYIPDYSGNLYAFSPSGTRIWKNRFGTGASSSPAIAANGDIIFGDSDGHVYAVTPAGAQHWTYATTDSIWFSSPAIDESGQIYIGSTDGFLYVLSTSGGLVAKFATGDQIYSSPLVSSGVLVYGSQSHLITFKSTGLDQASTAWPMFRGNARRTGRSLSAGKPTYVVQPASSAYVSGSKVTLNAQVNGTDDMTFQWYKDGVAISGATNSDYVIDSASAASAGSYTVVTTNSVGSTTSAPAALTLASADNRGYLANMSVRSVVGTGSSTLTFGYILGGAGTSGTTPVLVRASGPILGKAPYNVPGVIADPTLRINNLNTGTVVMENNDWDSNDAALTTAMSRTGLQFTSSPLEAALLQNAPAGNFTAEVGNKAGARGVSLAEVYDASNVHTAQAPHFINASTRGEVGTNADVLIMGFVIQGNTPVKLLVRGIGPKLAFYGVANALADPTLELADQSGTVIKSNDNWSADATEKAAIDAAAVAGFYPDAGSADAAMVVTLNPGAYTATVRGKNNTTGVGLVEIYEVP